MDNQNRYFDKDRKALQQALVMRSLHPAGDWEEDFPHENGNYSNICKFCGNEFTGHKRRIVCKVCATGCNGA